MFARSSAWLCLASLLACERTPDALPLQDGPSWQSRSGIVAVDIASDGKTLLLGEELSESTLWYAPWKRSSTLARVPGTLRLARFIEGGRLILATGEGGVGIFAADGGKELQREQLSLERVSSNARASDAGRFVAFDDAIYDLTARRWIAHPDRPAGQSALGFVGERAAWMAGIYDARVQVIGLSGEQPRSWKAPDKVMGAAVSGDSRYVAAGTTDGVVVWAMAGTEPLCTRSAGDRVALLRFSASGEWLAFTSGATLTLMKTADCSKQSALTLHKPAGALDIDGEFVALGDTGGYVYVWDHEHNTLLAASRSMPDAVQAVRLNATTGAVLAVSTQSNGSTTKYLTFRAQR